jgi:positive regulator of sigma E activity
MEIGSLDNFQNKFDKINDSLAADKRVELTFERKTNVIGTILGYLLMPIIFIALYFFSDASGKWRRWWYLVHRYST